MSIDIETALYCTAHALYREALRETSGGKAKMAAGVFDFIAKRRRVRKDLKCACLIWAQDCRDFVDKTKNESSS